MKTLAHQALATATLIPAQDTAAGEGDGSPPRILAALPAARLLLAEELVEPATFMSLMRTVEQWAQRDAESSGRRWLMLREPLGHSREVYLPLVLHLTMLAWEKRRSVSAQMERQAGEQMTGQVGRWLARWRLRGEPSAEAPDMAMGLWLALVQCDHALLESDALALTQVDEQVQQWLAYPGAEGSLHRLGPQQSLDDWTYQEFTGLHALMNLAIRRGRDDWRERVARVAAHHVQNTQPDNTTTQPWALLAFLHGPDTANLGEQQLHDARTQGLNPLTGLLLADAVGMTTLAG